MVTQLHAARLVLYQAAALAHDRVECGLETSMAKLFVTEVAKTVVLECQTIFGAYGYVKDFSVERIRARYSSYADNRRVIRHSKEQYI